MQAETFLTHSLQDLRIARILQGAIEAADPGALVTRALMEMEIPDTHRVPIKDRLRMLARYFEEDREHRRRKAKENIRDMTKDNRIQLTRAFAKAANQGGKHNAQSRRINLTPKGQVF